MLQPSSVQPILLTCGRGVAPVLAGELRALGFAAQELSPVRVETEGDLEAALLLNLHLRTAHRILWPLARVRAREDFDLYESLRALPWEELLPPDGRFSVTATLDRAPVTDARWAALKVKDAIADRMTAACGRRPDSGPDRTGAVLHIHWHGKKAQLLLDTSGEPLSRRGYRRQPMDAPMQETLAAACLLAAGWDPESPLLNPMCGSGTLAIEAALIASRRASGLRRENFGFMHVRDWPQAAWAELRRQAEAAVRAPPAPIGAGDLRPQAVAAARQNAEAAGVGDTIAWHTGDFRDMPVPAGPGFVVINPEHGIRLGDRTRLGPHYRDIGDFLKRRCPGWTAGLFVADPELARQIGLAPRSRIPLWSGGTECRLLVCEVFAPQSGAVSSDGSPSARYTETRQRPSSEV